jgi:hypothetical protein
VEKSIVNMFGHLQGHVQREMNDLETHTNSLLRRKTDVGAFVRGENAYAIVKCSFRDNAEKPTTVFDLKLSLNILASELISPVFAYQTTMTFLVKDLLSKRVQDAIEVELQKIDSNLVDEGKPEMTYEEKIFERIKALESHISDEDTEGSRRFSILNKKFLDAIEGVAAEISSSEYDALGVRENIFKIIETDNIRNRGFNTAVNSLTHVLDWSRMGYQHIENYKTSRRLFIREYEATDVSLLPDERYQMELSYFDAKQITVMREAYLAQLLEFERTIVELWDVVEQIYLEHRNQTGKLDWDVLSAKVLGSKAPKKSWFNAGGEDSADAKPADEKRWNEISFIQPVETDNQKDNPTLEKRMGELRLRFPLMREKLQTVFEETNPKLREIVENRLMFLDNEFARFAALINPFHLNPGVLLDVDIVTIKRKSTTMMKMANVLNEFLYSVSRGFTDSAFASFSRRRSTQRTDLQGEFVTGGGVAEISAEAGEEVYK